MKTKKKWFFIAPAAILAMALFVLIGGEIVRLLWNWLLPPLFGWRMITFWQALGLLVLCRILFGGLGRHGHGRGNAWRRSGSGWVRMTPEEKERFRESLRERFGIKPPPPAESAGQ